MNSEQKTCQNCKTQFTIEPDDFAFYEKMKVPPPTFCRECRLQRRMAFRNERTLYKRKCDAPGHSEELISVFSPDKKDRVYDHSAWWGDAWDPLQFGREIDFSKPFLRQVRELWREVPDMAAMNINPVSSDYCNITEGNKNCYLVVGGDFNENVLYSTFIFNSKDSMDTHWVSKSELNYETIDCLSCSRLLYSRYCEGCYDSAFLFNCKNCNNCFGCTNLTNKSYHIFNVPYPKDAYFKELQKMNLGSYAKLGEVREKFARECLRYPRKFARVIRTLRATGDNLEGVKNCRWSFEVFGGAEDCAYIWLAYSSVKNCFDVDHFGLNSENSYECSTIYPGSRVLFSKYIFSSHDVQYSYNCHNSSNLFGCVGLRNKKYCILNRQYTEEEYGTLLPRVREHMRVMPYRDNAGRTYAYGEFFPAELSPFAYNETIAQEYYPLSQDAAAAQGYAWKEPERRGYQVTRAAAQIPDSIADTPDSILGEIIGCMHADTQCNEQCTTAFKIIPAELQFYRRMNIPAPRLCPNCRYYQRIKQRNPLALYHRQCMCKGTYDQQLTTNDGGYKNTTAHFHGENTCPNEFETPYAPDRKEIVYCEACYQNEVV